jgi:hypothetical protein
MQVQAALYLGSRRLSIFSYSKPVFLDDKTEFCETEELKFWKPKSKSGLWISQEDEMNQNEERGAQINICLNVLLISKSTPAQAGFTKTKAFVIGSCQVSLFNECYLLRQGHRNLSLWPFVAFDPRMVC